jgi:hypothetical protein
MNGIGSILNYENSFGRSPRLMISPRHGGARSFNIYQSFDTPRGYPSGEVEFIISGGMGVSTPIIISEKHNF